MTRWRDSRTAAVLPLLFSEALGNLRAVHQRSALALLGIVIGTASVIAMINVGHNAGQESLRQFKAMGTDVVVAQQPASDGGSDAAYDIGDIRRLPQSVAGVGAAAPLILGSGRMTANGKAASGAIVGTEPSLARVARLPLVKGRFVSDYDGSEAFAVIGAGLARSLGPPGAELRPGDRLRMEDAVFTVIGVLADIATNPLIPVDFNDSAIVPLGSARRVMPAPMITSVAVRAAPEADPMAVAAEAAGYFSAKMRGQSINVQSARQLIAGMERQASLFTWLLAGIGGISLLVGGIGVMNVMLMGVMERRREIGVRMAVGARAGDIRMMFLIEAIVLSLSGGLAGAAVGITAAWLFAHLSGWHFVFSAGAIPMGTGVAGVIGVFFGYYPAAMAARLDPIAALRSE